MALERIDGPTIAAGETISDQLDVKNGRLVTIRMPAEWTAALLTFLVSDDGVEFADLYDYHGQPIAINVVTNTLVVVPEMVGIGLQYLKLRSGNKTSPVPQQQVAQFAAYIDKGR